MKQKYSQQLLKKRCEEALRRRGEPIGRPVFLNPIQFGVVVPVNDERRQIGINSRKRSSELRYP